MPKFTPTQQTMLLQAAAFYRENTNLTPFEAAIASPRHPPLESQGLPPLKAVSETRTVCELKRPLCDSHATTRPPPC